MGMGSWDGKTKTSERNYSFTLDWNCFHVTWVCSSECYHRWFRKLKHWHRGSLTFWSQPNRPSQLKTTWILFGSTAEEITKLCSIGLLYFTGHFSTNVLTSLCNLQVTNVFPAITVYKHRKKKVSGISIYLALKSFFLFLCYLLFSFFSYLSSLFHIIFRGYFLQVLMGSKPLQPYLESLYRKWWYWHCCFAVQDLATGNFIDY